MHLYKILLLFYNIIYVTVLVLEVGENYSVIVADVMAV